MAINQDDIEKIAELAFEQLIITAGLLFFAELKTVTYDLGLAILSMLARGKVTLLDGALFGVAALPFEE